ncbi:MAG: hypothetical protein RL199_109 [Pseudomonadota bacterium]|jgi:hypothetical protein
MPPTELERTLEAMLKARPTPRDLRDGLVSYFLVVGRPFVLRGLSHLQAVPDESLVRRLLLSRARLLWQGLSSPWESPSLADLTTLRDRIDRHVGRPAELVGTRTLALLDELALAAAVTERLKTRPRPPIVVRRLRVIEGGGDVSAPRGRLQLVAHTLEPVREGEAEPA